jgi:hypothetical protein
MGANDITTEATEELRQREAQSLAKANEAIAIRPKRGKLTLLSRRIYNALLYHAQKQGVDEPIYKLALAELIGDARFTSNNTELLKSHLRDMQATTIEWSTSSAGVKKWLSTQLIGTVTIEEPGRGKACFITWKYPDEIRERLVKPNQYTKVLLEISAQMRSYSAAVLYEIGARYLTSPGRLSMREDVIWWAAVLTGRSDIKEVDYRFLKRDVIAKALVEVDTLNDEFSLELIEHKQGRKVEELQFRILPKIQQALGGMNDSNKNVFDLEIVGRLIAIGLKQSDAQDTYATTDEGHLRSALDVVEQRMKNKTLPELKSSAAYFRDALKKGYTVTQPESNGVGQGESGKIKTIEAPPPSRESQMQRVRDAWDAHQIKNAREMFEEMSEAQKKATRETFEKTKLTSLATPIAKAWRRDGSDSRIAASSFFRWLVETTWTEAVSEQDLINFALSKGILKFG